jgi:hypothetical protein
MAQFTKSELDAWIANQSWNDLNDLEKVELQIEQDHLVVPTQELLAAAERVFKRPVFISEWGEKGRVFLRQELAGLQQATLADVMAAFPSKVILVF